MEKINYQKQTDAAIRALCSEEKRPRLLLHACCAPCSSYVLEYLCRYFDITVYFANPNITEKAEYEKRLSELIRFIGTADFCREVSVIDAGFSPEVFLCNAAGHETDPEGGTRCTGCFLLRLKQTADYAKKHGFEAFATTLTVSPHKDADRINRIGSALSESSGIFYLPSDFKKRGGYQRSIVLSREYGLYRQNYCGCTFSKQEAADRAASATKE